MGACWRSHIIVAQLLVENGAIVDLVNKVTTELISHVTYCKTCVYFQAGQSPLYLSCNYGETAAVRFLLEHGADVNLTTQVI